MLAFTPGQPDPAQLPNHVMYFIFTTEAELLKPHRGVIKINEMMSEGPYAGVWHKESTRYTVAIKYDYDVNTHLGLKSDYVNNVVYPCSFPNSKALSLN